MSCQGDEVTRVKEGWMGSRKLGKERNEEKENITIEEGKCLKQTKGFLLTKHASMGGKDHDGLILSRHLVTLELISPPSLLASYLWQASQYSSNCFESNPVVPAPASRFLLSSVVAVAILLNYVA